QKDRPRDTLRQSVEPLPPLGPETELSGVGAAVLLDETASGLLREHPAEPEITQLVRVRRGRWDHGRGGFSLSHGTLLSSGRNFRLKVSRSAARGGQDARSAEIVALGAGRTVDVRCGGEATFCWARS